MQLAEINVARLRYPLEDPRVADFVDNLDTINGLAERSEGFVWRLKDETGNATAIDAFEDPMVIVNMSVWASVEALHAFAYKTVHRRFVQRRNAWFEMFDGPFVALWWIEPGAWPTAYAFTFRKLFEPQSGIAPLVDVDGDATGQEPFRSCG